MKFIAKYLEDVLHIDHIKSLVEVRVTGDNNYVYVDGRNTGIQVSWKEYAVWLENKIGRQLQP